MRYFFSFCNFFQITQGKGMSFFNKKMIHYFKKRCLGYIIVTIIKFIDYGRFVI